MRCGWGVMYSSDTQEGLDLNPCHQLLCERPRNGASMESSSKEQIFQEIINKHASAYVLQLLHGWELGKEDLNMKISTSTLGAQHEAGQPAPEYPNPQCPPEPRGNGTCQPYKAEIFRNVHW